MWQYQAPIKDAVFIIDSWLNVCDDWAAKSEWNDLDIELVEQLLTEAGRLSRNELSPLNASGDSQGCKLINGEVKTPKGFTKAYQCYVDGGWPALSCDEAFGGQGLPQLLNTSVMEMLAGSNHAWFMYPGISHGAYECLHHHASERIKKTYLAKIVSGEWLVSMDITEPQAGSDVGLIKTKAVKREDGSYVLTGNKIFISGADHDLTDNVLHLVLARAENSPAGTKGLSLFLVSKYQVDDNGLLGDKNTIAITGIEHKMGIKGSATCSVSFESAKAELVGELNRGLAHMFTMMNSARLQVGLHGLGHMESARQQAIDYVNERTQGKLVKTDQNPIQIKKHAAIKHKINELNAFTEGSRIIAFWIAHLLDVETLTEEPKKKQQISQLLSLLTPIVKAFTTSHGFRLASSAMQVFGGYGYMDEYPIGQTLRDSRVAMIYEGTNEIQANDLVLRKILADKGLSLNILLSEITYEIKLHNSRPKQQKAMERMVNNVRESVTFLQEKQQAGDINPALNSAPDVMEVMGYTILAFVWLKTLRVVEAEDETPYLLKKRATALYYFNHILPIANGYFDKIKVSGEAIPEISEY